MTSSHLNQIVVTVLCTALMCGCASNSQKTPAAPSATAPQLPRDPVIDAYVGAMRADLSDGKIHVINSVMKLSNDEAKLFWPIYQDYETESFELGDFRVDVIRRFAATQDGKLEARDATELAGKYFTFEQQRLDLMKKYHGIIASELSPVRAAQFTQIEHRFATVIDLTIAAEMPLIQVAPTAPAK